MKLEFNLGKGELIMYFDWQTGTPTNEDKQYLCYMYGSYAVLSFKDGQFYDEQFSEDYDANEIEKWIELP